MLVHICCSVDSHYFLQELRKLYPATQFSGFFYNPNIHPHAEYLLRLADVRRSCQKLHMELIEGDYALEAWLEAIQGLEQEREKGARCNVCFDVRLEACAKMALMLGIGAFSTTLLSSPMKEQAILKAQGEAIGARYDLRFIYHNVRAQGGVERQNALAKRDKLYRQNYCGCQFALNAQRQAQNKPCIELLSPLSGQVQPSSIQHRLELFKQRDRLETRGLDYSLLQHSTQAYILLGALVRVGGVPLSSYILNHSMGKKATLKDVQIHTITLKPTFAQSLLAKQHHLEIPEIALEVGLSCKDDTLFLDTRGVATLLSRVPTPLTGLKLRYEEELYIRERLVGVESTQPIVVLDTLETLKDAPISIEITAQSFEHRNFYLLEHARASLPPKQAKEQGEAHP